MTLPPIDGKTPSSPADEADWLDRLLAARAAVLPADGGFGDAVLRALPPPVPRRAVLPGLRVLDILGMAAAAAMLVWTLPDALALLTDGGDALRRLPPDLPQRSLPAVAVLAWLGWVSLRHALDD